jgi:hypothetical protein
MAEAKSSVFIDRRTEEEKAAGLATPVLYWYDVEEVGYKDGTPRRRTNGMAVDIYGNLIIARATCSTKDQFEKRTGRLVVSKRIMGRAQRHCNVLLPRCDLEAPEAMAEAYRQAFPDDTIGVKRAFNAGKVFAACLEEMDRLTAEEHNEKEKGTRRQIVE